MKLNSKDFPIKNKIIKATETEIYYEVPKDGLSEAWDKLLGYYNAKFKDDHKEQMEENELYKILCAARVEAETGRTLYELQDKKVLNLYPIKNRKKTKCWFKQFILDSNLLILNKGKEILKSSMQYEKEVWNKIKNIKHKIKFLNGEIRIYVTNDNYVKLDENLNFDYPAEWVSEGLTCRVEYQGLVFESSVLSKDNIDGIEKIEEYFRDKSIIGKYCKENLVITIQPYTHIKTNSELCNCLIDEFKMKKSLDEIFVNTTLYLSRICLNKILEVQGVGTFINYKGPVCNDGYTSVFFVLVNNNVIKIDRETSGNFKISINEKLIYFKDLN